MKSVHPMQRFLGLKPDSDPLDILNIQVSELSKSKIESAVKARLLQIESHPDGGSSDAVNVCRHVEDAAALLLNPMSRMTIVARHMPRELVEKEGQAKQSVQKLTQFDQEVLGILVACGGWNARSRARLMAVASHYGISNDRLLSVLTGMAGWLQNQASLSRPRSGANKTSLLDISPVNLDGTTTEVFDRFVNRWMSDLRSDDARAIGRLSIIFGSISLILFGFMVVVLMMPGSNEAMESKSSTGGAQAPVISSSRSDEIASKISDFPDHGHYPTQTLKFPEIPNEMVDAADSMSEIVESLESIILNLNDGDAPQDEIILFSDSIKKSSQGWFLVGPSLRQELLERIEALFDSLAGDSESLSAYLGLLRFKAGSVSSAVQIPQSTFYAGTLSMLASSLSQTPIVRKFATSMLEESGQLDIRGTGFDLGALACLESFVPRMVELMGISEDVDLEWDLWIRCVKSLAVPDSQPALVNALETFLEMGLNPTVEGSSRLLLIRLLSELDYENSPHVRDMVLQWYGDSNIATSRLANVTRTLVDLRLSPRFDESTIIQPNEGRAFARRQRDRIKDGWTLNEQSKFEWRVPIPDGFDANAVAIWTKIWESIQADVMQLSDAAMMERLLELRLLNEAASAMVQGQNQIGLKLIRQIENGVVDDDGMTVLPVEKISLDDWSSRLSKARNREEKLDILSELSTVPSGSLSPIVAAQLAEIAYRASSSIRKRGQSIIAARFADDPEMMIALLDALPARPTKEINEFLENVLDLELPESGSDQWRVEVKRTMVDRSILLRLPSTVEIDRYVARLTQSYMDECERMGVISFADVNALSPGSAIERFSKAKLGEVSDLAQGSNTRLLKDLRLMHQSRMRLTGDSIQASLMHSLFIAEMMAYEWSVKLPSISSDIDVIIEDLKLDLPVKSHILEQLVLVEQSIADIWELVLEDFSRRQSEIQGAVG